MESPTDIVIYRSQLNAKINRNFEVFTPTDFLAAITQHTCLPRPKVRPRGAGRPDYENVLTD